MLALKDLICFEASADADRVVILLFCVENKGILLTIIEHSHQKPTKMVKCVYIYIKWAEDRK